MGPAMANSPRSNFAHRHKQDGTYNSICKKCVKTIANEDREADLRKAEDAHICLGLKLAEVLRPYSQG